MGKASNRNPGDDAFNGGDTRSTTGSSVVMNMEEWFVKIAAL
jgi:hypothetical protein